MKKQKKLEEFARRLAMKEQIAKQSRFFDEIDPDHNMDEYLHSFLSDNEQFEIHRDKNGFIDFENAYND